MSGRLGSDFGPDPRREATAPYSCCRLQLRRASDLTEQAFRRSKPAVLHLAHLLWWSSLASPCLLVVHGMTHLAAFFLPGSPGITWLATDMGFKSGKTGRRGSFYRGRDSRVCAGSSTTFRAPVGALNRNGVSGPSAKMRPRNTARLFTVAYIGTDDTRSLGASF